MRFSFENQAAMAGDGSKKSQVSTAPPLKMSVQKFAENRASELEGLHSIVSNRTKQWFPISNKQEKNNHCSQQASRKIET